MFDALMEWAILLRIENKPPTNDGGDLNLLQVTKQTTNK